MNRRILTILGVLAVAASSAALAAEGRIPIYEPTTISTPGSYVLTRDIDLGSASGSAITISVDGVTLDLNGKTILSDGGNDLILINYTTPAVIGVTVRNGRISGGYAAIYAPPSGTNRVTLENIHISNTAGAAVELMHVRQLRITNCTIDGAGSSGIYVDSVGDAFPAIIEGNIITDSDGSGMDLSDLRGAVLRNNMIDGFGTDGTDRHGIEIHGDLAYKSGGNLLVDNIVRRGAGTNSGIYIDASVHDNILERNNVSGNGGSGLHSLSHRNRIVSCTANDNGTYGILLNGDYNLVDRNTMAANGEYGLSCGNYGNAYRDNIFSDNGIAPTHTTACEFDVDAGGNLY